MKAGLTCTRVQRSQMSRAEVSEGVQQLGPVSCGSHTSLQGRFCIWVFGFVSWSETLQGTGSSSQPLIHTKPCRPAAAIHPEQFTAEAGRASLPNPQHSAPLHFLQPARSPAARGAG